MINKLKYSFLALIVFCMSNQSFAGNPDRIGEAGATHLIINPWARSAGWSGAYTAGITGVESMRFNVAGLVNTPTNEVIFSRTAWFKDGGININSFGLKTSLGSSSALGVSIMSFDFGDFIRTTTDNPDGTLGSFSPTYTNIGISYAYAFSDQTSFGVTTRIISEAIPDVSSFGVAIDAGIQYKAGFLNRFKLGFSLRNVGPSMRYAGNGLDFRAIPEEEDQGIGKTVQSRSATYELPTVLNIGVAYDFFLDGLADTTTKHFLTLAGNFVANSFGRDDIQVGTQYNYNNILMLRVGFNYQAGILDETESTTIYAGPSAGATFQVPLSKNSNKLFSLDYAYRTTQIVNGAIHTVGAKISF